MKPFLKWAGGKHRLVERICRELPPGRTLIEPFAGSAAVFLGSSFERNIVADVNEDLVSLFNFVKDAPDEIIAEIEQLFVPDTNKEDVYYDLRAEFNSSGHSIRKAALFVYLNRHCFNGLCRYNRSGKFNVPFGRYKGPAAPISEIRAFAAKSRSALFLAADFKEVMRLAQPGDVIYCDPPYVPLSETANFTAYASGDFSAADQEDLARLARDLARMDVTVVISNHDTALTRDLYKGAVFREFSVPRFISRDASNRLPAAEILAVFSNLAHELAETG